MYRHERDDLGEGIGWEAFSHTVEGTAGELVSSSEYGKRFRLTFEKIDGNRLPSKDILLVIPANLSVNSGDHVVALGKFAFPRDTADYAGEKNLWNR